MPTDEKPFLAMSGQDPREGLLPGSSAASSLRDTRLPPVSDSRADLTLQGTLPVLTGAFSPVGVLGEDSVEDPGTCS